jgi:hypothetical protein
MRKIFAGIALAITLVGSAAVTEARANGPSNRCYGQIASGIASTWPWAHDNKAAFEPSPGSIALWIKTFGPDLGISSVRQLQLLFCSE